MLPAAIRADLRARKNPKEATPASTATITISRLKMPMFMPWAIASSDLPKQAAQAKADDGKATKPRTATVPNSCRNGTRLTGS